MNKDKGKIMDEVKYLIDVYADSIRIAFDPRTEKKARHASFDNAEVIYHKIDDKLIDLSD